MKQSFIIQSLMSLMYALNRSLNQSFFSKCIMWFEKKAYQSWFVNHFSSVEIIDKKSLRFLYKEWVIKTSEHFYLKLSRWVRGSKVCSFFLSKTKKNIIWINMIIFLSMGIGLYLYLYSQYTLLAKLLGAFVFLLISLLSLKWGLYITVFVMPFINITNTLGLSLAVGVAFIIHFLWQRKFYLPKNPLKVPLSLFILVIFIAAITSVTPQESIKQLLFYLTAFIISGVIIFSIKDQIQLNELIYILTLSVLIVSLYGIYQYFIGAEAGSGWVDAKLNPDLKTRVYSTLENPNILAEYLVLFLPLSVAGLWNEKNKFRQLLYIISIGLGALCLIFTFSRGGWVGFALALGLFIFIREPKLLIPLMIIALISLFFVPDVILARLSSIGSFEDTSNAYRLSVWQASLGMIGHYGLTGVGLGYAASLYTYPAFMLAGIKAAHAHNIFLQLTIELGIVGILVFLWLIIKLYRLSSNVILKGKNLQAKTIAISVMGAFTGHLFHGLVEYVWFHPKILLTFWVMVGILIAAYNLKDQSLPYSKMNE